MNNELIGVARKVQNFTSPHPEVIDSGLDNVKGQVIKPHIGNE